MMSEVDSKKRPRDDDGGEFEIVMDDAEAVAVAVAVAVDDDDDDDAAAAAVSAQPVAVAASAHTTVEFLWKLEEEQPTTIPTNNNGMKLDDGSDENRRC